MTRLKGLCTFLSFQKQEDKKEATRKTSNLNHQLGAPTILVLQSRMKRMPSIQLTPLFLQLNIVATIF